MQYFYSISFQKKKKKGFHCAKPSCFLLGLDKCPIPTASVAELCYGAVHFELKQTNKPSLLLALNLPLASLFGEYYSLLLYGQQSVNHFSSLCHSGFYILSPESFVSLPLIGKWPFHTIQCSYCSYVYACYWHIGVILASCWICFKNHKECSLHSAYVIDGCLQFAGPKTYSFSSPVDSSAAAAANLDKSVLKVSIFFR